MRKTLSLALLAVAGFLFGYGIVSLAKCSHKPHHHTPTTADTLAAVRAQLDSIQTACNRQSRAIDSITDAHVNSHLRGIVNAQRMLNEWADRDSIDNKTQY